MQKIDKSHWFCHICKIGFRQAVNKRKRELRKEIDRSQFNLHFEDELEKRLKTYKDNLHRRSTCGVACGRILVSMKQSGETDVSKFFAEEFYCQWCKSFEQAGRYVDHRIDRTETIKLKICTACFRKHRMKILRKEWELKNREHRRQYDRQYRKDHKDKYNKWKRDYYHRRKQKLVHAIPVYASI